VEVLVEDGDSPTLNEGVGVLVEDAERELVEVVLALAPTVTDPEGVCVGVPEADWVLVVLPEAPGDRDEVGVAEAEGVMDPVAEREFVVDRLGVEVVVGVTDGEVP
jgi:hypothetical protein